jgi:hypothetical protein
MPSGLRGATVAADTAHTVAVGIAPVGEAGNLEAVPAPLTPSDTARSTGLARMAVSKLQGRVATACNSALSRITCAADSAEGAKLGFPTPTRGAAAVPYPGGGA